MGDSYALRYTGENIDRLLDKISGMDGIESVSNKVNTITENSSDEKYPSAKAVFNLLSNSGVRFKQVITINDCTELGVIYYISVIQQLGENITFNEATSGIILCLERNAKIVFTEYGIYFSNDSSSFKKIAFFNEIPEKSTTISNNNSYNSEKNYITPKGVYNFINQNVAIKSVNSLTDCTEPGRIYKLSQQYNNFPSGTIIITSGTARLIINDTVGLWFQPGGNLQPQRVALFSDLSSSNTGGYQKPEGGIPQSDLSSSVQDTLNRVSTLGGSIQGLIDTNYYTQEKINNLKNKILLNYSFSMDAQKRILSVTAFKDSISVGEFGFEDTEINSNVCYVYISKNIKRIEEGALSKSTHYLPNLRCIYIERDSSEIVTNITPGSAITEENKNKLNIETNGTNMSLDPEDGQVYYQDDIQIFDDIIEGIVQINRRMPERMSDLIQDVQFLQMEDLCASYSDDNILQLKNKLSTPVMAGIQVDVTTDVYGPNNIRFRQNGQLPQTGSVTAIVDLEMEDSAGVELNPQEKYKIFVSYEFITEDFTFVFQDEEANTIAEITCLKGDEGFGTIEKMIYVNKEKELLIKNIQAKTSFNGLVAPTGQFRIFITPVTNIIKEDLLDPDRFIKSNNNDYVLTCAIGNNQTATLNLNIKLLNNEKLCYMEGTLRLPALAEGEFNGNIIQFKDLSGFLNIIDGYKYKIFSTSTIAYGNNCNYCIHPIGVNDPNKLNYIDVLKIDRTNFSNVAQADIAYFSLITSFTER